MSFGVFLPYFVDAYQANVGTISLAVSLILLVVGFTSPVVGRLLDQHPVRKIFLAGGLFLTIGFIGVSFSNSTSQLFLCYLSLGLGAASFAPLVAVKHMSVWFPNRLGLATSLVTLPIGAVAFPPLSQWLIVELGWRSSMRIFALLASVAMLTLAFLKPSPSLKQNETASLEASNSEPKDRFSGMHVYKRMLFSRIFWFLVLAFCIFQAAPISILTHFLVVAENKGFLSSDGVLLLTILGFSSLVGAPMSGLIADKFGPKKGYMIVAAFQCPALVFLLGDVSYTALTISAITFGLFLSASYVFFAAFAAEVIGDKYFGTGFGLATFIAAIVAAFPPVIAGIIFDAANSYDYFFGTLALLTFIAGMLSFLFESQKIHY